MYRSTMFMVLVAMLLLAGRTAQAAERIAVLDFELNDLTFLPYIPEERRRTASFRPLLEQALKRTGNYEMVRVDAEDQAAADAGLGYLFRFPELAAGLGEQAGADWVVVCRHSKPSFMFSYLIANLVDVKNRALAADYAIELKGSHDKVSQRSIEALAKEIHDSLSK
jgi:hypothetical protein